MKRLFTAALLLTLFGCGENSQKQNTAVATTKTPAANVQKFDKDGIQFDYPENWNATEEGDITPGGRMITVEKSGMDESGIVLISSVNTEMEPAAMVQRQLDIFREQFKTTASNIQAGSISTANYGSYQGSTAKMTADLLGLKHTTNVYSFSKNGKTYIISEQGADEDSGKNAEGFEMVKKTFAVK